MKNAFYFRTLALFLAWLLILPQVPWITGRYGRSIVDATTPGDRCTAQEIMQAGCTNSDLAQLETDSVQSFLALHGLPSSDSATLYTYGRTDVRNEVRSIMLVKMVDIITRQHQGATLTQHEQALFNWIQGQVWTNEKALYQEALNDRNSWETNPCSWTPDPDIATAYQLSYSPPSTCSGFGNLLDLFNVSPVIPSKDYFLATALKRTYGDPLTAANASMIATDTANKSLIVWGAIVGGTTVAAVAVGIVIAAVGVTAIFPYAIAAGAASVLAGVSAVAIPLIVLVLVLVAIDAGFDAVNSSETMAALADLDTLDTNIQTTPPDLYALTQASDGNYKLVSVLTLASVPETSSTATLPTHGAADFGFSITPNGQSATGTNTLNYLDWDGTQWSAQTWGGWFVQTGTTKKGTSVSSISPTIRYVDWSGTNYYAGRVANSLFLIVKSQPNQSDAACMADATTGVSTFGSTCSSAILQSFQLQASDGTNETVSLSAPPIFTTPAATNFSVSGSAQTFNITATGAPTPTITFGANPNSGAFTQSSSTPGTAQIVYSGGSAASAGQYIFSLTATNINGTVMQSVTITLGDKPVFTSSPNATFVFGVADSFLIIASGFPVPSIAGDGSNIAPLPTGLSLHDNGNGTATVSGTPTDSTPCSNGLISGYKVDATNSQGTTQEFLSPNVICSSSATRLGPQAVSFTAGLPNTASFSSTGGVFPGGGLAHIAMTCSIPSISDLTWLSCKDNGNGTATLSGTPPLSEIGRTFVEGTPAWVQPHAPGSVSDITPPSLSLYIAPIPLFNISGSNPLTDAVFFQSESNISGQQVFFTNSSSNYISNNSNATFTERGHLPGAVTFASSNGDVSFSYDNTSPNASTGGVYPVIVVGNDGVSTQEFPVSVYVFAAPQFVSAATTAFNIGQANTFNVITQGFPKTAISGSNNSSANKPGMTVSLAGTLPMGVTFTAGNAAGQNTGAAVLSGTPCGQCAGTYPLTLTASNAAGGVKQTFTLTVPGSQTISGFATLSNLTYGAAPFTISGVSATSGLPVSLSSATTSVCTVAGATVTIKGAGPCTIAANQMGNSTYPAAPTVSQSFMVNKAALTVTASNQSITYGATPAYTAAVTGFVNGENAGVVSGTAAFSTNATTTNGKPNAGSWTIMPAVGTLSASNYTFGTFNAGSLTVGKPALTVTADAKTTTYGSSPALTATITGFVNGDTATVVSGSASLSSNATTTNGNPNAGSWTITPTAGTLAAGNYTFGTFNSGALTVNKATLTVTANNQAIAYGASAPAPAATIAGYVNSDTSAVVGGTASFTSNATATNGKPNAGSWTITPSAGTLSASNYGFSFSPGTLTVNQATLTVTANNAGRSYGAANPPFSAAIAGFVNGDTSSVVTGSAGLTTTAIATSAPGAYPITAAQGTLANPTGNYSFSFVPGTLAINGAVLTVTPAGGTRTYGAANTLSYGITGFVNGETTAVVSGSPSLSTTAVTTSSPGNYPVTATQGSLASANYTFAFNTGTLTVTQAASALFLSAITPGNSATVGQNFTVTLNALPIPGAALPTGTVIYSVDGGANQSASLSGGSATLTLAGLNAGVHKVVNSYSGDTNYLATTPTTLVLTVTRLSTQLSVTAAPSASVQAGQTFTLNFSLAGNPAPTGSVTYSVDGGTSQTVAISGGQATVTLSGLASGSHTVAYSYGGDSNYGGIAAQTLALTVTAALPVINNGGIVGAAGASVQIAPGGIGTIYGTSLAAGTASAQNLPLPTTLENVQVLVNGTPSPLFYVSPTQINFQVPSGTPVGTPVQVVVITNGISSLPLMATIAASAPSIFTYQRAPGQVDPVILHGDNTLVTPASPAKAGEVVVIYGTGISSATLNNPPADGTPAPLSPLATSKVLPTATVGGAAAFVQFSGLTPGYVGLLQINIQLPAVLPAGTGAPPSLPLTITYQATPSTTVNLWVDPIGSVPTVRCSIGRPASPEGAIHLSPGWSRSVSCSGVGLGTRVKEKALQGRSKKFRFAIGVIS